MDFIEKITLVILVVGACALFVFLFRRWKSFIENFGNDLRRFFWFSCSALVVYGLAFLLIKKMLS